jgi:hypothetical protein
MLRGLDSDAERVTVIKEAVRRVNVVFIAAEHLGLHPVVSAHDGPNTLTPSGQIVRLEMQVYKVIPPLEETT